MQHNKTSRLLYLLVLFGIGLGSHLGWSQNPRLTSASSLTTARKEVARGDLVSAERTLWTLLSGDPNQTEALTLLAVIRGRQKRYPESEALLRRVLQLDPKSPVAHQDLATALIAQNKPDAAIDEYKEVVKLSPGDRAAKVELARLYVARGDFAEALSTLETFPSDRLPIDAVPAKAASLLGLGRTQEASALISRAKESPAIAADLAEVFLDGNAPEYALKTVDAVLTGRERVPARIYYLKGRALQVTGDRLGAMNSFREVLARDPKSVDTLVAMAAVRASQGEHAQALDMLNRAYALQPGSPAVLRRLVIAGIQAGQRNTALRAAHELATRSPDNLDDLYLAAAAMLEGRDFVTASSIFEKYVAERPQDSKGFLGLGIAQLAQQHYAEARTALQRALEIDPGLADAEYQLGALAEQQGTVAEALQHFARAVELQPRHAKALAGLGAQYLQGGDLEKADSLLERSVTIDPNNSKTQYDLALVLAKLGRTKEAKQHMDRSRVLKAAEDAGKSPAPVAKTP